MDYGVATNTVGSPQYDGLRVLALDNSAYSDSYINLANYLTESGGSLTELEDNDFDSAMLSHYDVIILGSNTYLNTIAYSDIKTWVSEGGSLVYDYAGSYSSTAATTLLQGTDITVIASSSSGSVTSTNFTYHPITLGVQNLYGYKYINLELSGTAEALARTDDGTIFSAACTYGDGKNRR